MRLKPNPTVRLRRLFLPIRQRLRADPLTLQTRSRTDCGLNPRDGNIFGRGFLAFRSRYVVVRKQERPTSMLPLGIRRVNYGEAPHQWAPGLRTIFVTLAFR